MDLARRQMVEQQLRCWDVSDPSILDVVEALERDRFVPAEYQHLAYADAEIPLPCGQRMMTPIIEGRLLQALLPTPTDSVLEIGTGSGYLAACLGKLAGSVLSIDLFDELTSLAQKNLEDAGIDNVTVEQMDAIETLPEDTFDCIAVTGSVPEFDERFVELLNPGGRLFVIVGKAPVMSAMLVTRDASDEPQSETLFETVLAPLENLAPQPVFRF